MFWPCLWGTFRCKSRKFQIYEKYTHTRLSSSSRERVNAYSVNWIWHLQIDEIEKESGLHSLTPIFPRTSDTLYVSHEQRHIWGGGCSLGRGRGLVFFFFGGMSAVRVALFVPLIWLHRLCRSPFLFSLWFMYCTYNTALYNIVRFIALYLSLVLKKLYLDVKSF